jgi:hypothetical protein
MAQLPLSGSVYTGQISNFVPFYSIKIVVPLVLAWRSIGIDCSVDCHRPVDANIHISCNTLDIFETLDSMCRNLLCNFRLARNVNLRIGLKFRAFSKKGGDGGVKWLQYAFSSFACWCPIKPTYNFRCDCSLHLEGLKSNGMVVCPFGVFDRFGM